jgi:hypothetical protein
MIKLHVHKENMQLYVPLHINNIAQIFDKVMHGDPFDQKHGIACIPSECVDTMTDTMAHPMID